MFVGKSLFRSSQDPAFSRAKAGSTSSPESAYILLYAVDSGDLPLLNGTISDMGYSVVETADAGRVLQIARDKPPAAVVADISYDLDRVAETVAALRSVAGGDSLPVLFLCEPNVQLPGQLLGDDRSGGVLHKPIFPGDLRERLGAILRRGVWRSNIDLIGLNKTRLSVPTIEPRSEPSRPGTDRARKNTLTLSELVNRRSMGSAEPSGVGHPVGLGGMEPRTTNGSAAVTNSSGRETGPLYDRAVVMIREQLRRISQGEPIQLGGVKTIARQLIERIKDHSDLEVRALNQMEYVSLQNRMVNMVIFAIMIGFRLNLSDEDMMIIATAGLTHDLGMALVPDYILSKNHRLSDDEFDIIKQHLRHTEEIIENAEDFDPDRDGRLLKVVLQVHEREGGTGYPMGLKRSEIDPLAKILAVADVFEAFSHPRNYRKSFVAHEAICQIVELKDDLLDSKAVKALVSELSIFPIDSYVQLNNGQIGRVIAINKSHPLRPVLEILFDENRKKLGTPRSLDLKEAPFLFITKTLLKDDLTDG